MHSHAESCTHDTLVDTKCAPVDYELILLSFSKTQKCGQRLNPLPVWSWVSDRPHINTGTMDAVCR